MFSEPPILTASLEVKFNQPFVSTNEVMDKESSEWRRVEEEIHTKVKARLHRRFSPFERCEEVD
jgi:hypothetical protein